MTIQKKRLIGIIAGVLFILMIPLVAMQFTTEVVWTLGDFIVAGILLLSVGLVGELIIRKVQNSKYRVAILITLLVAFLLLWAELAVGIFGSPIAGS